MANSFFLNKGAKAIQWGKDTVFSKWYCNNHVKHNHTKKKKNNNNFTPCEKIKINWVIYLNIKLQCSLQQDIY